MKAHKKLLAPMLLCGCAVIFTAQAQAAVLAHYRFDSNPTLLNDSSGNSRTLSASASSPTLTSTNAFGGGAASFAGSPPQYFFRDNEAAFQFGNGDFAVSLWYQRASGNPFSLIGNGTDEDNSTSPNSGFTLRATGTLNSPTLQLFEGDQPPIMSANLSLSESSAFQHVLFQRQSGQYQLWVNNTMVTSATPALNPLDTLLAFGIGADNVPNGGASGDNPLQGLMDEVIVFNNALTPSQIEEIFTSNTYTGGGEGGGGGIPEPGSMVLLAGGILLSAWRRKRR